MNTDIVYLRYSPDADVAVANVQGVRHPQSLFREMVSYLFRQGSQETDVNHVTVVVVDEPQPSLLAPQSASSLDNLSLDDKLLAIRYFFGHLNVVVVDMTTVTDAAAVADLNQAVAQVSRAVANRISRVEAWTETGPETVNDAYLTYNIHRHGRPAYSDVVTLLSFMLCALLLKLAHTAHKVAHIKQLIVDGIDFKQLLGIDTPRAARLAHAVGYWGFPAHELTNDDLVYCVFLMIKYALCRVPADFAPLSDNELLAMVMSVRDTYKLGNPFHNFRHAVDVVQACFHFLVRLGCLPKFDQFVEAVDSDAGEIITHDVFDNMSETLTACGEEAADPHLNSKQTLALLVAALGHDVGHPGVTNPFMIKYQAPASLMVNERLVLELYHSLVFINRVLACFWPTLLMADTSDNLSVRHMITLLILATDMAEHFEYIAKLNTLQHEQFDHEGHKVQLISSLLIKCADISNVTRPLRVLSQWAYQLARETEEVGLLESKLANDGSFTLDLLRDLEYTKVATKFEDILASNDQLHKGQIFFINTFAENLFHKIAEYMPQLQFTEQIICKNKQFWLSR